MLQITRKMANLLAATSCDLGDERDVIRTLRKAGIAEGDIVTLSDAATDAARAIRADSSKLVVS